MKKYHSFIYFLIILLMFICISNVYGVTNISEKTPSKNEKYRSYDYVIDKYDVNMKVNEDNSFDITETITAYFNKPKHGIYRTIPLVNYIYRLDGSKSINNAQVNNVSVTEEYVTTKNTNNYKIIIGSSSSTLTGEKTYVIKYKYNIGNDFTIDYDELYYNIIGNDWDTVIGNVTFSITMPKDFDSSKLGFSSGRINSTDNEKIKYIVKDNIITGSFDSILEVGEGITIRCELPEGYFKTLRNNKYIIYLIYCISVMFLIYSIYLWKKYGQDEVVETVEFYPPKGYNSLEVAFLYKGEVSNKDVISLLIYLANKGYIMISDIEKKRISKNFKITKLKDYDGNNINEKIFLDNLFKKVPTIRINKDVINPDEKEEITEVKINDLKYIFYNTVVKIKKDINSKENKKSIIEENIKTRLMYAMIAIIYFVITFISIRYSDMSNDILSSLIITIFLGIGPCIILMTIIGKIKSVINGIIISSIWNVAWGIIILPVVKTSVFTAVGYSLAIISMVIIATLIRFMPKRNKFGSEILGKIKGFKNFIETVQKEKLEELVMDNPTYFYDILPYAYVLDVSDKWIKKFEFISAQPPLWYGSKYHFNKDSFGDYMNSVISTTQTTLLSNPSGGSSSGGGSSGGGSGGGGGGSW